MKGMAEKAKIMHSVTAFLVEGSRVVRREA